MNLAGLLRAEKLAPATEINRAVDVATRTGLGLAHVVVRSGLCDASVLASHLAQLTGLPLFDPHLVALRPEDVRRLPYNLAARRRALVIAPSAPGRHAGGQGFQVAFSDPTDRVSRSAVQNFLGLPVDALLIDELTLERGIEHFYGGAQPDVASAADMQPKATEVALPELNLTSAPSFLTESTAEALRTYQEPMAARQPSSGPSDADLKWLRAKAGGESSPPATSPPATSDAPPADDLDAAAADAFEEPAQTEVVIGVMSGLTAQAPPPDMTGALDGHTEEMVRLGSEVVAASPTLIDDSPPVHVPSNAPDSARPDSSSLEEAT